MLLTSWLSVVLAQDLAVHQALDGGIAVDGSAVTAIDEAGWTAGDDLHLQLPAGASVAEAWLILLAEGDGFTGDPVDQVRLNGQLLSGGATLLAEHDAGRLYALDLSNTGVASGWNSYEEAAGADGDGGGLAGAVLGATWQDSTLQGRRFVSFGLVSITDDAVTLTGTPDRGTLQDVVASFAIVGSCADDQDASAWVDGTLAASYAGGRDDGDQVEVACADAAYGASLSVGGFGFDDSDTLVGVDGDEPDSEPGGTSFDSRRADELWRVRHTEAGEIEVRFGGTGGGGWVGAIALSLELDEDEDGVADAHDNCIDVANADQADTDWDGIGNACDVCIDEDGDGHGVHGPDDCATDCDDEDPDVNPDQVEDWYDGIDQDCSGGSDFDADGDGDTIAGVGGTDCDDTDPLNAGTLSEVCDGQDNDCDGLADDDDDDVIDGDTYYVDLDQDGWGAEAFTACEQGDASQVGGDCDDFDANISPAGHEVCDTWDIDEDCDGLADDDDPDVDGTETWYEDADGDGWGNPDTALEACDPPQDWITQGEDCDDTDPELWPGSERVDENCEARPRNDGTQEEDFCGCAVEGRGGPVGWLVLLAVLWRRQPGAPPGRCGVPPRTG